MKLKSLNIEQDWSDATKWNGKIEVEGAAGKIQLNLSDEQCQRLMQVVAEELVNAAKSVASDLTAQCLDIKPEPQTLAVSVFPSTPPPDPFDDEIPF